MNSLNHKLEIFKTKYPSDFFCRVDFILHVLEVIMMEIMYTYYHHVLQQQCFNYIDYKYFAGTNNPIEIILKYLQRGYGTILNGQEITKTIKYCYSRKMENFIR